MATPPAPTPWRPSRRGVLRTVPALAAGALLPLAGCSNGSRQTVLFHQSKPEAVAWFRELAAKFTAAQQDYRVVHGISTNLSPGFVRGNPPDLGCLNYNLEMARFQERGALSDLADLPQSGMIRDDIVELTHSYPQYPGRTSVLPYSAMAAAVIYNKRIFADHGIDVPTTWDALIEVCEKLAARRVTPFYATFAEPWTIAQGWFDYVAGGMLDITEFYRKMNQIGPGVGPDSEVSFQTTMLEPVQKMLRLARYTNQDATSRGYGDGNTAFAHGQAAMIMQGPWAFGEFEKARKGLDLGTFPLPATNDPNDLKVRVNIDLALWIPQAAHCKDGARAFLQYLMQPRVQNAYNAAFLGYGTTRQAPPVTDPRLVGMRKYYDSGKFYLGPSQFVPQNIPTPNYFQAIVLGADPRAVLAQIDRDWARLAFRR